MSVQSSSETSRTRRTTPVRRADGTRARERLGRLGLAIAAINCLVSCNAADSTAVSSHSSAATVAPVQRFIAQPVQRLLFTAKPSAAPADAEAYVKAHILPALARDPRIGDVATYVDARTGGYVIEAELRTLSPANLSLALDVLGASSSDDQARKVLDGLAKYFSISNVQQLTARADLSVSRRILGTVDGGSR
jgi:hypothetical protein